MATTLKDAPNKAVTLEEHLFLGASWEDKGVRRNVRRIQSEFGEVVAYENWLFDPRLGRDAPISTRVPGFYVKDLTTKEYPAGDGMLVSSVPKKLRESIKRLLISNGYETPIDFE